MKAQNENLSANESLDLIAQMIQQAQGNVRSSGFHFLLWGWVVALANLGMFTLIQLEYSRPYIVWLITIPAWLTSMYYGFRHSRENRVTTHIDKTTMWLWISYGITIFTLVFFGSTINWNLNPIILLMTVVPTLVSGIVIRFKPLVIGGISIWFFSIVCFLMPLEYQYLVGALAVVTGYLIPGYLLKNKKD
jgi:hypothetical protein